MRMKMHTNRVRVAVREHGDAGNRPVQVLLLSLWAANIAFFLYFLLKHGLNQPW